MLVLVISPLNSCVQAQILGRKVSNMRKKYIVSLLIIFSLFLVTGCVDPTDYKNKFKAIQNGDLINIYEVKGSNSLSLLIFPKNEEKIVIDIDNCKNSCNIKIDNTMDGYFVISVSTEDSILASETVEMHSLTDNVLNNYFAERDWTSINNNDNSNSRVLFYTSSGNNETTRYFFNLEDVNKISKTKSSYILLKVKD